MSNRLTSHERRAQGTARRRIRTTSTIPTRQLKREVRQAFDRWEQGKARARLARLNAETEGNA